MVTSVLVVAVNRLGKEDLIEDSEASRIAGTYTEDNEILGFFTYIDDFDVFALHFEIHNILGLREEEILSAADCIESAAHSHAAFVLLILGSTVVSVYGKVESLLC
ncbi:MAG: hypothetical protein BWZ04_02561 [Firmicutes bacterium ADurb.BinA205]|nr:MAG: hypothetical protein BWZ04_02561 [Firmicutes bacterium ADurb.BinA205]